MTQEHISIIHFAIYVHQMLPIVLLAISVHSVQLLVSHAISRAICGLVNASRAVAASLTAKSAQVLDFVPYAHLVTSYGVIIAIVAH